MKKSRIIRLGFVLAIIAALAVHFINDKMNDRVFVTEYTFSHPDVPPLLTNASLWFCQICTKQILLTR